MPVTVAIVLAAVAGYVDALTYLMAGAFVANMTGNTVLLGISLIALRWDQVVRRGGALACFLLGVLVARRLLRPGGHHARALAMAAGLLLVSSRFRGIMLMVLLAGAMGMQDASVMRFGGISINTVFVTGDLVKLGSDLMTTAPGARRQVLPLFLTWVGYLLGAIGGAWAHSLPVHRWHAFNLRFTVAACIVAAVAASLFRSDPQDRETTNG